MDTNHRDNPNHNPVTTEDKLWLPSSFTNSKASVASTPKKKGIKWGFSNRTVFDWAMLVSQVLGAIAIPFVVTMIGLYLTQQITQQQAQSSERQHQTDLQIAQDQQQDLTVETYLDRMSGLLLNSKLHESRPGDEVRIIARAWTVVVFHRLDTIRKGIVLRFLYETNLIGLKDTIVSLIKADLRGANLRETDLHGANLSGAWFRTANFSGVNLAGADLSNADLAGAIVTKEQLSQTKSLKGATMPDGSIHP